MGAAWWTDCVCEIGRAAERTVHNRAACAAEDEESDMAIYGKSHCVGWKDTLDPLHTASDCEAGVGFRMDEYATTRQNMVRNGNQWQTLWAAKIR